MNQPRQRYQAMKLITETIEDVKLITEEKNGKKLLYIEGVFLQSELKNRNGRMYPSLFLTVRLRDTMRSMLNQNVLSVNLDIPMVLLSILIEYLIESQLKAEGNNFIGKAQILDTPMGNIAKNLLGEGVQIGCFLTWYGKHRQDRKLQCCA